MGMLIPNPADQEIIAKLNYRFSEERFGDIRLHNKKEKLFDNSHHLHRVAYRMEVWPESGGTGIPSPRARWFYFLKKALTSNNQQDIKYALNKALGDSNCIGVIFNAVQDQSVTSQNDQYKVTYHSIPAPNPATTGSLLYVITLSCYQELDKNQNGIADPDQGGDKDTGEKSLPWEP